jgi:hypothetical protein
MVSINPEAMFTYLSLCPLENAYQDSTSGGTAPYSLAWDWNNDGVTDTTAENFIYNHPQASNQNMSLTVIDAQGCRSQLVLPVDVMDSIPTPIMPNVLLRNPSIPGNDCWDFEVFAPGFNPCIDYDFYVYNRWGVLVFQTENTKANPDQNCLRCFCGVSSNQTLLSSGIYYYILKGKGATGAGIELQGQLMLME